MPEDDDTIFSSADIRQMYGRRAAHYDRDIALYKLLGFREQRYRGAAIEALRLGRGDVVVDLGCGNGRSFGDLEAAVGPEGRLIGVDLTPEMLAGARERIYKAGWNNVELVQSSAGEYEYPDNVAGIICTCAIIHMPEVDEIIRRASAALRPGGRLVILGMKEPGAWPRWMVRVLLWLTRPYDVCAEYLRRRPWESVTRYLQEVSYREFYWGLIYLSVGEARQVATDRHLPSNFLPGERDKFVGALQPRSGA